jgi:hypothetical protein
MSFCSSLLETYVAASPMSLISEPSFSAYTSAQQGGFSNLTVVDNVALEMLHLTDPHWLVYDMN